MQDSVPTPDARHGATRVFLALGVPEHIAASLASAVPVAPDAARIVHPADMHVTLHFLGDQTPEALSALTAGLDRCATSLPGGTVRLDRTFALPSGNHPRLVAAEARVSPGLHVMREHLTDMLVTLSRQWPGLTPESRPWRPHVTLYWLKRRRHHPLPLDLPLGLAFDARAVGLYASQPGQVPRYRMLASWPLRCDEDD